MAGKRSVASRSREGVAKAFGADNPSDLDKLSAFFGVNKSGVAKRAAARKRAARLRRSKR